MVFIPPSWLPELPHVPDSITVAEFILNDSHGRRPFGSSRSPFTCGITGQSYSARKVSRRVDNLARAISKRLQVTAYEGVEWDRVVCIYSVNALDYIPLTSAIHQLSGIVTTASASLSASELEQQLRSSGAIALFTCIPLLEQARRAASAAGIPEDRIFILSLPNVENKSQLETVDSLISYGEYLEPISSPTWIEGQGRRQTAFLCYSSGTSGLPKAVMLSHYNVIACVIQIMALESVSRKKMNVTTQICLGVLPFSHIYGLAVIGIQAMYRGDEVVVLPEFSLDGCLSATQRFKIERLNIVPPVLVQMISQKDKLAKHDLSSVRLIYTGAAPLGKETAGEIMEMYPKWHIVQAYGMTECSPAISSTTELDMLLGSSGHLVPGSRAKIVDTKGKEITSYGISGEMLFQSPAVMLGYLNNEKATTEALIWDDDGCWLRTGDECVIRRSARGHEHVFVVDRIKELIKVKGHQVAPAELEAHILTHPFVSDCAVIPVVDPRAGELPKAYVVKDVCASDKFDVDVADAICKHVEKSKAKHKWLQGGVEFISVIPKSPSGKILRRVLRDKERQTAKSSGAKL